MESRRIELICAGLVIEPATLDHAMELAPRVKSADVCELRVVADLEPMQALEYSLEASLPGTAYTAIINGEIVAMWGLAKGATPAWSVPWLLTSEKATERPVTMLKIAKYAIGWMHKHYGSLVQTIPPDYDTALRFVKHLGFEVLEPAPIGANGALLHPVARV